MAFAVRDLTKSYGGVVVLNGVDLTVNDGEIHALLGANGAGKSTLIKAVCGAFTPDRGVIELGTHTYESLTPKSARRAGVRVIHQDPAVIVNLTVADNVFLGEEQTRSGFLRRRRQIAEAQSWFDRLGFNIDARRRLGDLSNADLQLVEITRALRVEPQLLILDEPTAALTEDETDHLLRHLRHLKTTGLAVLYVTHRLSEVFAISDHVTVLAGGRVKLQAAVADVGQRELVRAITGSDVQTPKAAGLTAGRTVLEVDGLTSVGIGPIDLVAREGEVLGVYGLLGAGRTELVECLAGAQPLAAGTVRLDGASIAPSDPAKAAALGVTLVPSDRLRKSVFLGMTALDNVCMPSMSDLATAGVRSRIGERAVFDVVGESLSLHPRNPSLEARGFSGGNQQKLVVGRWLHGAGTCRVLLLDEPTQGVDVGARSELYRALRLAAADRAVIVTSSEPEELVQLADRVIVLGHGRVLAELSGEAITEERLLAVAHLDEHNIDTHHELDLAVPAGNEVSTTLTKES
jgi:ribose transport system ATP-binding protein